MFNGLKHRDLVIAAIKAPVTLVLKLTPVAPVPSYGTVSEGGHAQVESFPPDSRFVSGQVGLFPLSWRWKPQPASDSKAPEPTRPASSHL
jgi:hypothetical protein